MSDADLSPDIEPRQADASQPGAEPKGTSSSRKSLSKLRRELTDDELSSPAVQRMLVDEIERLDVERNQLVEFRDKFYDSKTRIGVLEEKFTGKMAIEVIHVACNTVGAAALGYAPSIWDKQPMAWLFAIFGTILVVMSLIAKVIKVKP
ncbi:hypothetical protein [Bordetella bronchiseptica]|nr:hypothetical protein [Bordetella bronchiseptica]